MADYKKLYLELFHTTEEAIHTLIAGQQKCEELYMASPETELTLLPAKKPGPDA